MISIKAEIFLFIKKNVFPLSLILIFLTLGLSGVSGSSQGIYDKMFFGTREGILAGTTRSIRSDEWLFQTQSLLIQHELNYPVINKSIGLGQDMSLLNDVPTRTFYTIFKPQNLFFFILPFEMAFSFHWWFMSLLLCLSFYLCFSVAFPRHKFSIAIISLLLLFNPFIQWWYQSITLLSVSFALFASLFFLCTINSKGSLLKQSLFSLGFCYFLLCFIFCIYPAFQIPLALVLTSMLLAWVYYRYKIVQKKINEDFRAWLLILFSLIVSALVVLCFFITHANSIKAMANTEYPGKRDVSSGEYVYSNKKQYFALTRYFSAPVMGNLQSDNKAAHFFQNQSEASTFIFINLIFAPFVVFSILKKPRSKWAQSDYLFLCSSLLLFAFIVRFFTPYLNFPFKLLLMNHSLNERAEIALILLCCIQLALLAVTKLINLSNRQAIFAALLGTLIFGTFSVGVARSYPLFVSTVFAIICSILVGITIFLILKPKLFKFGLLLFLAINVINSIFVNPLYVTRSSRFIDETVKTIKYNYPENGRWATLDTTLYENIPSMAGKSSLTGVLVYPQLDLWKSLDPLLLEKYKYNRFAHIVMGTEGVPSGSNFYTPQNDALVVRFSCDNAKTLKLNYLLSPKPVEPSEFPCTINSREIKFPNGSLYIYKIV